MNPEELSWSLLNRVDLRQITGLTYTQTRFILSLISEEDIGNWLAWHDGLGKWTPLRDFDVLSQPATGPVVTSPPLPPIKAGEQDERDVTQVRPSAAVEPRVDKRSNRRFQKEYLVEIVSREGKVFTTNTVNISSNGMLLEEVIPIDFGKNFVCKLSRQDGSALNIFCAVVRDATSEDRTRVRFTDVSQPKTLLSWLIDSKTK